MTLQAYFAPLPNFIGKLSSDGNAVYKEINKSQRIAVMSNLFFGLVTKNPYIKLLRVGIALGCIHLNELVISERLQNISEVSNEICFQNLTISCLYLFAANVLIMFSALYSFVFCSSILYGIYTPYYAVGAYRKFSSYRSLTPHTQPTFYGSIEVK